MNHELLALITLFSILIVFISLYLLRIISGFHRKKNETKNKKSSEVGFVVDTFHDLVSKLKEKER